MKRKFSFNDSKWKSTLALSCSKNTISVIKRYNFYISWLFLFPELLSSFSTEKKLQSHKNVCGNKNFCNFIMPSKDTKILELNQY